jgi:2-oxoglutarate ferredoxin oxidoreductase subunit alpha
VPELNMGQLALLIRAQFGFELTPFNKIQGRPFTVEELLHAIRMLVTEEAPA